MIAVLREKYREIKRLRTVDAEHRARGQAHDPKPEMAALARRFPGALRELDELPMQLVEQRLSLLDAAIEAATVPEWAALQVAYHGTYRFALRIKRHVARKGALDNAALAVAIADLRARASELDPISELAAPRLAELDEPALLGILRPAGGRLHGWVLHWVAAQVGASPAAVAAALFLRERTVGHAF